MQVTITTVQGQGFSLNFQPLCFLSVTEFTQYPGYAWRMEEFKVTMAVSKTRNNYRVVTDLLSYGLNSLTILYLLFSSLLRSGLLEILNLGSFFANSFRLYRRHRWESPSWTSVPSVWTGTVCFTLLTDAVLPLAAFLKLGASVCSPGTSVCSP